MGKLSLSFLSNFSLSLWPSCSFFPFYRNASWGCMHSLPFAKVVFSPWPLFSLSLLMKCTLSPWPLFSPSLLSIEALFIYSSEVFFLPGLSWMSIAMEFIHLNVHPNK
jgi:hypothetical protein